MIWILASCRFAEAMGIGMLIPVLPVFLQTLGNDGPFTGLSATEQTGILYGATGLCISVIQAVAGPLSDRLDHRKSFILAGLVGGSFCSAVFALTTTFEGLLTMRLLQGLCLGFTFSPMMAILSYHAPVGHGGRVLGTYSTIRLVGFSLGPLVGGLLSDYGRQIDFGGHALTFVGSAVLLAISTVMVSIWVPDHSDPPVREDGKRGRVPGVFYLVSTSTFLMMLGISAIISLFPYYQQTFGASDAELGLCYAGFVATRCLFQYPCGWLGDRQDKKRMLLISLAIFVPLILLQGFVRGVGELVALRALLGVASAGISTAVGGINAERSPPGLRASTMATHTIAFSLGISVGPILGGLVAEPPSIIPFAVPSIGALVLIGLIAALVPSDRSWHQSQSKDSKPNPPSPE